MSHPITTVWNNMIDDPNQDSGLPQFMLGWCWVIWSLNIFIIFIILMNFLIGIISQTYDDVSEKAMQFIY